MNPVKSGCCGRASAERGLFIHPGNLVFHRNTIWSITSIWPCKTGCKRVFYEGMGRRATPVVLALLLCSACASSMRAQVFQNLDFEDANLVTPSGQFGGPVPITNALPYWTGYIGTNQVTQVLQNDLTLGDASIDILGPNWPASGIIQGQYTLVLQSGVNPFTGNFTDIVNAAVAQVGLVPTNARSILLEAQSINFTVSFSGQPIALSPLGTGSNYTLFGGDISAFAGQVGELRISGAFLPGEPDSGGGSFDAISFSTEAVPEPSGLSLLLIGIMGFGILRLNSRKTG